MHFRQFINNYNMLRKLNRHTKQAPEFDLVSRIRLSSYLFLPESSKMTMIEIIEDFI